MKKPIGIFQTSQRIVELLGRIQSIAASLAIAGIVVLLVGSSVRRYLLGQPIGMTEEVVAFLFVTLACLSVTEGYLTGRQIRIELIWRMLPNRIQGWAMVVGHGVTALVLLLVIRETWSFAFFSFELKSRTDVTEIIMWPWMMLIPGSLAILVLAVIARAVADIKRMLDGQPVLAAEQLKQPPN